jgi:hypothetical protein
MHGVLWARREEQIVLMMTIAIVGRRSNLLGFERYRSHSEGSSCELCQLLAYKHLCHQANDRDLNAMGLRLSNTAEDIARIAGRQRTEYHQQL